MNQSRSRDDGVVDLSLDEDHRKETIYESGQSIGTELPQGRKRWSRAYFVFVSLTLAFLLFFGFWSLVPEQEFRHSETRSFYYGWQCGNSPPIDLVQTQVRGSVECPECKEGILYASGGRTYISEAEVHLVHQVSPLVLTFPLIAFVILGSTLSASMRTGKDPKVSDRS